jgi:hypothetical protein
MRKIIIVFLATTFVIVGIATAQAKENKPSKKQSGTVTLTNEQFMALLNAATGGSRAPGLSGPSGSTGKDGAPGQRGERGEAGAAGERGPAGPAGPTGERGVDGTPGRNGAGFTQGVVFMVNGACPTGTTIQGAQNRWTVYANDTSGRPWTTSGSSAQLFLSACQVD